MRRWVYVIILLCIFAMIFWLNSCSDEAGETLIQEKRIVLLDQQGAAAGRFLPDNEEIPKLFRILGREKQPFFTLTSARSAVFEGLPIHEKARLTFLLGADKEGEVAVILNMETLNHGSPSSREETRISVSFSEPGWERCEWTPGASFGNQEVRLSFLLPDETPIKELIIGDPIVLSQGVPVTLDAVPPLKIEDAISDLLKDFENARQNSSNPDRPLSRTVWRLDPEKRTAADDAKKVIRAAPDSEFVFALDVPADAFLDAAVVILPAGNPKTALDPGNVEFAVSVNGTRCASIRSDYINANNAFINLYEKLIHWERIDLAPWAGGHVEISFQTVHVDRSIPADAEYAWWEMKVGQRLNLPRATASPRNPNVIVLCIDALRADHLGCYGYDRPTSENLDAFASKSLLFENAVSPCSWTLPSTASLLTGLQPNTHGVLGNTRNYLVDGITTLAEFLTVHGITTAAFTANELVCAAINFDQGFERFIEGHDACAERLNDDLIAWMESCGSNQFFAYVHYMEPHSPYSAPGRFRQHFDPDYVEKRDYSGPLPERWRLGQLGEGFSSDEAKHLVNLYDSEIYYWDFEFKRLLQTIESLSLKDETVIVVTSDHGEEFFDHAGLGHGITLYQEVIHVPLIIYDPRQKKGRRISEYVNSAALFSTVSDRLGLKTPGFVQVESLFPLERISSRFQAIYSSTERNQAENKERWASMIIPPYKRITGLLGAGEMLFNLAKDPQELNNLLLVQPDQSERFRERILEWYQSTAEAFPDEWQPLTQEILQKLKNIGYIE